MEFIKEITEYGRCEPNLVSITDLFYLQPLYVEKVMLDFYEFCSVANQLFEYSNKHYGTNYEMVWTDAKHPINISRGFIGMRVDDNDSLFFSTSLKDEDGVFKEWIAEFDRNVERIRETDRKYPHILEEIKLKHQLFGK